MMATRAPPTHLRRRLLPSFRTSLTTVRSEDGDGGGGGGVAGKKAVGTVSGGERTRSGFRSALHEKPRASKTLPNKIPHPGAALKVGETLTGMLPSIGGAVSAYLGLAEDGAITLTRRTGMAPKDERGRRTGPRPTETTVLVAASPRKMARTLRNRQLLDKIKKEEEQRAASGGVDPKGRNMAASVMA